MQTNLHRRYCYTADYYVIANKNVYIVFKEWSFYLLLFTLLTILFIFYLQSF